MENRQVQPTDSVPTARGLHARANSRIISYALFIAGGLLFLAGLFSSLGIAGSLISFITLVCGVIFYRRGK